MADVMMGGMFDAVPGAIRIRGQGHSVNTRVDVLQKDGTWLELRGVSGLKFFIEAPNFASVSIDFVAPQFDVIGYRVPEAHEPAPQESALTDFLPDTVAGNG